MLGSLTTPDRSVARGSTTVRVAFQVGNPVGVWEKALFAAQWPACVIPCRCFALPLKGHNARLGGDVTRYVFIVEDLHLLLLAGLPAHYQQPLIVTRWRVSVMARLERAIPLNGALPPMTRSSRAMTMTGCTGDKLRPLVLGPVVN